MLYELLNLRKELKHLEPIIGGIIKPTEVESNNDEKE